MTFACSECPVWIRSKVRDIDLELFGGSKLGRRFTYATYHVLFSLAGNPLRIDLRMIEFSQTGAACPVDVDAHPIGLGSFCKVYPRRVVYRVTAYSMVSSRSMRREFPELGLISVVETCPSVYLNTQLALN